MSILCPSCQRGDVLVTVQTTVVLGNPRFRNPIEVDTDDFIVASCTSDECAVYLAGDDDYRLRRATLYVTLGQESTDPALEQEWIDAAERVIVAFGQQG